MKKDEPTLKELTRQESKSDISNESKIVKWIILGISAIACIFHLYTAATGILPAYQQRPIHLAWIMALLFIVFPLTKNPRHRLIRWIIDGFLAIISVVIGMYLVVNYEAIVFRMGAPNQIDVVFGVMCILLVLEGTRRAVGNPMAILASIMLLYAFIGPYMPGILKHRGYSLSRIASHQYLTTEGIFSSPMSAASTFIILFILFGNLLTLTGGGDFFLKFAYTLTAWAKGGAAKTAVLGSGLFGMISGSAVANVVTTGNFTLPLMKKSGYKSITAASVLALGSTGGQLAPPVMGAAAFVMSEFLGVPYFEVVKAACIPAFLYYLSLIFMVHMEADRNNIQGIPRSELTPLHSVLKSGFEFIIPIIVLIYMLSLQWSAARCVFISMVIIYVVSFFRKQNRISLKDIVILFERTARGSITVSIACACAGIVVGVVSLTGLGLRLSSIILSLAGGILPLALFYTMIASIILGMGLPTTACYIVLAVLAAPAIIEMGVSPMAAHLFIFYFGIISNITPPVALASYAAAGLSKDPPMKVGFTAFRMGIILFVIPYFFIYNPLLLFEGEYIKIIVSIITASLGVYAFTIFNLGWCKSKINIINRLVFLAASLLLIQSSLKTDLIGFGLMAVGYLIALKMAKSSNQKGYILR
ncbi:MAG: TRAP-type uncharacterized transport system, fused permease component [Firmicutes bacterium]|nr:TRAP-type uncharacterized transport system, fused permease component [Bacillota bacterium]